MPLHTEYRPTKLADIIGNKDTVAQLKTHLAKEKPNRCLIFIGPAGCGKTTLARCVAREVIGGGEEEFDWNFTELNAADFKGIDTVREVRSESRRNALGKGEYRVWLWDEAHMISGPAQEALLKLLEDPPPNAWFLFGTTNPEKLGTAAGTLRRRLTHFVVEPLAQQQLKGLMVQVCRKEGKKVPTAILDLICKEALCSPGTALKLLDDVIDLPEVDMAKAVEKRAAVENTVVDLCQNLLKHARKKGNVKWEQFVAILKDLESEDPESIRRQVLEYFRKVMADGDRDKVETIMWNFATPYYDTGRAGLYLSVSASVPD